MQSEQCYRQWRKCRRGGGGGRVRFGWRSSLGVGGGGLGGVGGLELGSGGRWRVVVLGASCYLCPTTRK